MKIFKFLFLFVVCVSSVGYSADAIDYDKPFNEIQEQISSFDSRHSLMPQEVKQEAPKIKAPAGAVDLSTSAKNVDKKDTPEKPNEATLPELRDISEMPVQEKGDDFKTVVVSGRDDKKDESKQNLPPVVLKPIVRKNVAPQIVEKKREAKSEPKPVIKPQVREEYFIEEEDEDTTMAHIASYKEENSAYDGVKVIKKKYPEMENFDAYVKYEYVPNKGWYYRLYVVGDKRNLELLCSKMKKNNDWCNIQK